MTRLLSSLIIGLIAVGGVGGYALAQNMSLVSSTGTMSQNSQAQPGSSAPVPGILPCGFEDNGNTPTSSLPANPKLEPKCRPCKHGAFAKGKFCERINIERFLVFLTLHKNVAHLDATIEQKGVWVTYSYDRGEVDSISPSSITITDLNGSHVTDTISATTKFRRTTEATLKQGDNVIVVSRNSDASLVIGIREKATTSPSSTVPSPSTGITS